MFLSMFYALNAISSDTDLVRKENTAKLLPFHPLDINYMTMVDHQEPPILVGDRNLD